MSHDPASRPILPHMERLRHEFERWLEAAWSQGGRAIDAFGLRQRPFQPAIDLIEHPDAVEVFCDLPGVDPAMIELTLTGQTLSLRGEFPEDELPPASSLQIAERPRGNFIRHVTLPPGLDPETVQASGQGGVLKIVIQKYEEEKPRRIPIHTGSAGSSPEPEAKEN